MDRAQNFLAIDLGASNGRVVLGRLTGDRLRLEVVHRFDHAIRLVDGHKRWDWPRIHAGVREGLAQAAEHVGDETITSVSCDAWAQDFGLTDVEGNLIYSPVSYRDSRSEKIPDGYFDRISPDELVARVGVGALPITALCQLYVMARQEPDVLAAAATMLHTADLVHHDLCGVAATDWTMATASQLRNLATEEWDRELLAMMDIPHHLLPPLIEEPRVLGPITEERAPHPKLIGVPVVVTANHDTSAASFAAGPFDDETLFLSEGTYAMLGCVSDEPIISPDAVQAGCALVGLAGHRWGLFTSVMGLWIVQECCRLWASAGQAIPYDELMRQAEEATIDATIALSYPGFHAPDDMMHEVRQTCLEADIKPPQNPGETAKLVFDSMVQEHKGAIGALADLTGRCFRHMHVVSGGSKNAYLCQGLATALRVPVDAGPAEATAIGNILLQARVMGAIPDDEAAMQVLSVSFPRTRYEPGLS